METASAILDNLVAGNKVLPEGVEKSTLDDRSSVSKALQLLRHMGTRPSAGTSVSELAHSAELPKSTTHRLLKVLEAHGFVGRAGVKYRLGNRMFEISESIKWNEHAQLRVAAVPVLEALFDRVVATVHLAVLRQHEVVYVEKISSQGGCRIPTYVGARLPATCTALGKSMLAYCDEGEIEGIFAKPLPKRTLRSVSNAIALRPQLAAIRRDGVAFDREESRLGVVCVASPVLVSGRPLAAISVSGLSSHFSPERVASRVAKAAQELSSLFDYSSMSHGSALERYAGH